MKKCTKCGIEKSLTEFYPCNTGRKVRYLQGRCKVCAGVATREAERKRREKDPISFRALRRKRCADNAVNIRESNRKCRLKTLYGLSLEEYDKMVELQNGRCAICDRPSRRFCIDHDHSTGKIRSLLCNNCNRGIGYLKDSFQFCIRAASYLRKFSS